MANPLQLQFEDWKEDNIFIRSKGFCRITCSARGITHKLFMEADTARRLEEQRI